MTGLLPSKLGTLSPKQAHSIGAASAEVVIWHGAVSSGKTIGSLFKLLMKIATAPTSGEIVIIGRTRDTVYRNIMQALLDPALFGDLVDHISYNRGAPTATIFGRTVHILGSSDVRAESTIRGMTICIAYLDEATLVSKEFFSMLHSRLRVKGYACQLFVTTNPDAPRHWLKTDWIDREHDPKLNIRCFHFEIEDNRDNLPDGYIETRQAQYSGLWYDRFILGKWTMADGVIYDCFDPARHVVDQIPEIQRIIAMGIDDGVNHPAAGLLIGLGIDNKLYAMAEWAPPSGTPADRTKSLRRFINEHGKPERFFVDPSAAALKMQMQREGFGIIMNAHNSHKSGIGVVSALLSTDQLLINGPLCTNLLGEIGGYVWDRKAAERGEDAPVKEDDDFCDAWRYGVFSSFTFWRNHIPIEITIAEEVAA
ncbi:PBSX family phage terminase large subunit [Rhodococcus erythropolis]|uniref:PBSX family phage terminase large subunit n=1 Tax=Rhodococcus baikonurensis TaxID=172041 RepID=UPI002619D941|nr:PBSX family phage terminase large subunit [uncultured Rhodococcus sp.]